MLLNSAQDSSPYNKVIQPHMSIMLKLKNPATESEDAKNVVCKAARVREGKLLLAAQLYTRPQRHSRD